MTPVLSGHPPDSLLQCANRGLDRESKMRYQIHRRTGNFLPGGGGKPFAQKILASVPNFYERVEKKRGHIATT